MNTRTLALAMTLALAPAAVLAASVYKWTDEDGVTHFGDRQPTGQQTETVNVRSGSSSQSDNRNTPQQRVNALDEQQREQSERQNLTAREEARQKQRKANCEAARKNLEILSSNNRIRVAENGEQRYLSPEEIAEQKEKAQAFADENCGPEEPDQ